MIKKKRSITQLKLIHANYYKDGLIEDLTIIIEKWRYFFNTYPRQVQLIYQRTIGSDMVIQSAYEALNQFNWNETELIAYEYVSGCSNLL